MADSSKTEQATPKRRDKAREQGQVARSRELPGVFALAAVAGVMMLMAPAALTRWGALYRNTLSAATSGEIESNGPVLFWSAVEVMRWSRTDAYGGDGALSARRARTRRRDSITGRTESEVRAL